jgi:hypothetical protein
MKTKSEIIEALATVLDKHCKNEDEVSAVLGCIIESVEFMTIMGSHRKGITHESRAMKQALLDRGRNDLINRFDDMSDSYIEGTLIAGSNTEGLLLLNAMQEEINAIL